MEDIDYKELRRWLDWEDIQGLADDEGITKKTVYNRLSGKTKNCTAFLERAYKIAIENKTKITEARRRLREIGLE